MDERIQNAYRLMDPCALCPRQCKVHRLKGEVGFCGIGALPVVSSAGPHWGEESVLVGQGGSGTIFFAGCNLGCVFCQNFDISHGKGEKGDAAPLPERPEGCFAQRSCVPLFPGHAASPEQIAEAMLQLQRIGCININYVTPTHVTPHTMEAIAIARGRGLRVPTVYNCGGYESVETLRMLEGFIDIYMPDAKFADPETSAELCRARDYPEVNRAALKEMHRQVGDLAIENGVAKRGLLVRHLVMPNDVCKSLEVMDFLANEISPKTFVNVMDQYRPVFKAREHAKIARPITPDEFSRVHLYAQKKGLRLAD